MNLPLDVVAPDLISRALNFIPPLRYQRTLFVGSPCSDEGFIGLLPGMRLGQVAPALQAALEKTAPEKKAALIVWKDFPEENRDDLEALARDRGLFGMASFPNTRINLEGLADFEGYLKQLTKENRWKLRKKLKLSHALGELDAAVAQHPSPAELDEIFGLFWQTYTRGKTKFERLTQDFFRNAAASDRAWFVMLRDPRQGNMVAFKLCFLAGRRLINKYIGIDYRYGGDWYLFFRPLGSHDRLGGAARCNGDAKRPNRLRAQVRSWIRTGPVIQLLQTSQSHPERALWRGGPADHLGGCWTMPWESTRKPMAHRA